RHRKRTADRGSKSETLPGIPYSKSDCMFIFCTYIGGVNQAVTLTTRYYYYCRAANCPSGRNVGLLHPVRNEDIPDCARIPWDISNLFLNSGIVSGRCDSCPSYNGLISAACKSSKSVAVGM